MKPEFLSHIVVADENVPSDPKTSPIQHTPSYMEAVNENRRRPGKKRSKIACRNCRRRKVRCDVHPRGAPCTNCRLDCIECTPCEKRASKWCAKGKRQHDFVSSKQQAAGASSLESWGRCRERSPDDGDHARSLSTEEPLFGENQRFSASVPSENSLEEGPNSSEPHSPPVSLDSKQHSSVDCPRLQESTPSFLMCDLSRISNQDLSYLRSKGCFSLPVKDILDDLLQCYFDYVHPTMPFVDETEFWDIYLSKDTELRASHYSGTTQISLLLFQAILFAATTCASLHILRRAGYNSRMIARRDAFFKVRALYSLDVEQDKVVLLQTFLLMSYWRGDAGEDKDAWHWSGLAISVAASLGLHHQTRARLTQRQETLRRRCWWSCVLRDRIVALSEQRQPRLQFDDFDVPLLTLADYNIGLRSGTSQLSSGEELGKRTALTMFSIQLIRLLLCYDRSTTSRSTESHRSSPAAVETWARTPRATNGEDELSTGFEDLDFWMTNLPEVLQRCHSSDGDETVLPCILVHRSALHIYYHKLILSIITPRLLAASGEPSVRYLQLANRSSVTLAKLHNELVDHDSIHCIPIECFGVSTSSFGLEPQRGGEIHTTKIINSSVMAGTRLICPPVTPQMNSKPLLRPHQANTIHSMDLSGWHQSHGPTTQDLSWVDSALDLQSQFPWPFGDDDSCGSMLSDIPDLTEDGLSVSTVETNLSSLATLMDLEALISTGPERRDKEKLEGC